MMHDIRILVAAVAVLTLTGFSATNMEAQGVASPGKTTAPHFWDDIPVSPSTAAPEQIEDGYWHGQFERVNREVARAANTDIVFFGDSITWYWSQAGGAGQSVWRETYQDYSPINMGNSGDITPVMLYRVTHGNLDFARGQAPKVAVLLCGTNNFVVTQSAGGKVQWDLGPKCPPENVAHGARAIAQVFRRRLPRTRVIMMGILPVSNPIKWAKCQQTNAVNAAFTYSHEEVVYLDLQDRFLLSDGSINETLFSDGTHLTPDGYRVWADSLAPLVSDMIKAGPLKPVKIMLLGDSITEGLSSSTAYRRYLDGMLRRKGLLIDFVGSRKKHHNNHTAPDSYEYDVDHEGHWGRDSDWLAQHMASLLVDESPDAAVIHLGTEDIVSGRGTAEALTEKIVKNMHQVITALRSKNRTIKIVLSRLIPIPGRTDEVNLLNRKITRYVREHATVLSPIVMADPHTGFSAEYDLTNSSPLPNATGAQKMAQTFADVIHPMLSNRPR
jgi:lysophospholipase L1-like esterase